MFLYSSNRFITIFILHLRSSHWVTVPPLSLWFLNYVPGEEVKLMEEHIFAESCFLYLMQPIFFLLIRPCTVLKRHAHLLCACIYAHYMFTFIRQHLNDSNMVWKLLCCAHIRLSKRCAGVCTHNTQKMERIQKQMIVKVSCSNAPTAKWP